MVENPSGPCPLLRGRVYEDQAASGQRHSPEGLYYSSCNISQSLLPACLLLKDDSTTIMIVVLLETVHRRCKIIPHKCVLPPRSCRSQLGYRLRARSSVRYVACLRAVISRPDYYRLHILEGAGRLLKQPDLQVWSPLLPCQSTLTVSSSNYSRCSLLIATTPCTIEPRYRPPYAASLAR